MRAALIVSAVLHLSLLAAMLGTFGQADSFSTPAVAALPVELVSIDEVTDLLEGRPDAEEIPEQPAPRDVETELEAEPETQPGTTGEEADTVATQDTARAAADESAAPEPAAEPEPEPAPEPEPVAETEPEPAPAPEPEPVAEEPPQETVAAVDPVAAPEPEPAEEPVSVPETVTPQRKPPPPPRRQQRETARQAPDDEEAFSADRLSALINRTDGTGGGAGAAQASLGAADGAANAALTLSEKDALRSQMQRCWNPPIGLANAADLIVVVRINLLVDGSVGDIADVGNAAAGTLQSAAADAARRAVIQCQPYLLPPEKYSAWREIQVTFDPRDLF